MKTTVIASMLLLLVAALMFTAPGCVTYAEDDGTLQTDLLWIIPLFDEPPAPPSGPDDVPPWEADGSGWLVANEDGQVAMVRAWNAAHGWTPDPQPTLPRGLPWWVYPTVLVALRAAQTVATRSGRANYGVMADGTAPRKARVEAFLHNTLATSSPPEARARMGPRLKGVAATGPGTG